MADSDEVFQGNGCLEVKAATAAFDKYDDSDENSASDLESDFEYPKLLVDEKGRKKFILHCRMKGSTWVVLCVPVLGTHRTHVYPHFLPSPRHHVEKYRPMCTKGDPCATAAHTRVACVPYTQGENAHIGCRNALWIPSHDSW